MLVLLEKFECNTESVQLILQEAEGHFPLVDFGQQRCCHGCVALRYKTWLPI
jgi:hypothetical protein